MTLKTEKDIAKPLGIRGYRKHRRMIKELKKVTGKDGGTVVRDAIEEKYEREVKA